MKTVLGIIVVVIIIFFISKLLRTPRTENAETVVPSTATTVVAGSYESTPGATVAWQGKRPLMEGYFDSGTLNIVTADVVVVDGAMSGTVVFDMSTITAQATGLGGGADKLTTHLQSPDFFDVLKYPTATLVVNKTTPTTEPNVYTVDGMLTMKGATHPITFPITAYTDNDMLHLKGLVIVNRTTWGVQYGSGTFFSDIGEKMIDDMFEVTVDLALEKK